MALIKCKDCGKEVSDIAPMCPNCGRPLNDQIESSRSQEKPKKKYSKAWVILAIVVVILWLIGKLSSPDRYNTSVGNSPDALPKLELMSHTWHTEYDYAVYEGTVRNISSRSIENVEAVVSFYDKQGGFITSSEALINFNPILPGQTSPFKVMKTHNPAMEKAAVDFKYFMGGSIPYKEAENKKRK